MYDTPKKHYKNTDSSFHILSIIFQVRQKHFIRVKNIVISTDNVVNTTPRKNPIHAFSLKYTSNDAIPNKLTKA